jgi:hypothetical protein
MNNDLKAFTKEYGIIPGYQAIEYIVNPGTSTVNAVTGNNTQNTMAKILHYPVVGIETFYDQVLTASPFTGNPLPTLTRLKNSYLNVKYGKDGYSAMDQGDWIQGLPLVSIMNINNPDLVYKWQARPFDKLFIDWNNTQITSPAGFQGPEVATYSFVLGITYMAFSKDKPGVIHGTYEDSIHFLQDKMASMEKVIMELMQRLSFR